MGKMNLSTAITTKTISKSPKRVLIGHGQKVRTRNK